jgi:hypothetical protein
MDEERLPLELNNVISCEAFCCYENAVQEINVKVGRLGFIKLSVCSKCKDKFVAIPIETSEASFAQNEVVEVEE